MGDSNLAVGTKLNWMHKRKNFIKLVILPLTGSVDEEMVNIGRFVSDQGSFLIKYAPFAGTEELTEHLSHKPEPQFDVWGFVFYHLYYYKHFPQGQFLVIWDRPISEYTTKKCV